MATDEVMKLQAFGHKRTKWRAPIRRGRTILPPWAQQSSTLLTIQHTTQTGTGIVPTYVTATIGGNTFVNTFGAIIRVKNNSGRSITVTVVAQQACNQGYLHNYSQTIADGAEGDLGPFDYHYQATATNKVTVLYDSAYGITVAAIAP